MCITSPLQAVLGIGTSHLETRQWLHNNRFGQYLNLFANFSAEDLLRMSRKDLIEICGPGDGIRLFNLLRMKWAQQAAVWCVCVRACMCKYVDGSIGGFGVFDVYTAQWH